ncbi:MAG: glycerol dehydrogenase [Gammaproteobacteria bacterium]|nr:glycerol dehydrogenase [Gammaproteobacteria bacterium]
MQTPEPYQPASIFAPHAADGVVTPRVFIAPQRYIQGPGVVDNIGRYLTLVNVRRVAILISDRGRASEGPRLLSSLESENIECVLCRFGGETSLEEIELHQAELDGRVDCLMAVGGGKCVDAGKSIAFRLGIPVVIVPTLASNDAPCSAASVLYSPSGVYSRFEFVPQSPALVVVDTGIVATAPERYLAAGMGDAMATWYEAQACLTNPNGVNVLSARPTLASTAMGEVCAHTLFEHGVAASSAVRDRKVDAPLEAVVEANTLLSGLGFESGGVAVAHGVAQTCTSLPGIPERYHHGEMVAIGTLVQLALEERRDETARVARFFAHVGLPAHLGQLSVDTSDAAAVATLVEGTLDWPFTVNMPFDVDASMLRRALFEVQEIGESIASEVGDTAYRRLQDG